VCKQKLKRQKKNHIGLGLATTEEERGIALVAANRKIYKEKGAAIVELSKKDMCGINSRNLIATYCGGKGR